MVWYMQDAFCWRTKFLLLDFRHNDHCIRPHCRDIFLVWGPARLASIDIPVAVLLLSNRRRANRQPPEGGCTLGV